MSTTVGIFYGSSTGNTESAAEKIEARLAEHVMQVEDVAHADPADLENHDLILLGVSTWNIGEMQDDWAEFIPKMEGLNLSGKKVAFFAMGDASGYPYNFLDALGELWDAVKVLGSPELIGVWPTEEYDFEESKGLYDEDHFLGLGLDDDNEPELTDERIDAWLGQLGEQAGLSYVAAECAPAAL